jgi:hypothetical protein
MCVLTPSECCGQRETDIGWHWKRDISIYIDICINYTSFQGNYQSHTLSTTTRLAKLAKYMYNISTLVGFARHYSYCTAMTSNQFAVCLPMHRKCRLFFACRLQPICQRPVFENWFFCLFERERERERKKASKRCSLSSSVVCLLMHQMCRFMPGWGLEHVCQSHYCCVCTL